MGLLPDTHNYGLRMRRECRERFPRPRLQRKPLVNDPAMHHGTCVTHVPWCMSGSLTCGGGGNVPGIPGACATHNFTYLARGPCDLLCLLYHSNIKIAEVTCLLNLSMHFNLNNGTHQIIVLYIHTIWTSRKYLKANAYLWFPQTNHYVKGKWKLFQELPAFL